MHAIQFVLTTLSANDKSAFLAKCTDAFAKVAEPQFTRISKSVAPHLRQGYSIKHLGDLNRGDGATKAFKIEFADGAHDALAMISEKDDRISGLLLK